ncbi:response regulator [bacterium]|nr:response regulator [bacterium]
MTVNKESILIVEQDTEIRGLISEVVQSYGFECESVSDGLEALKLFEKKNFDIVMSDVSLPNLGGLDLIPQVRKIKPETTFIIITGFGKDYSYERIMGAGAQDFIKKPFTSSQLNNKLNRVFTERKIVKENINLHIEQKKLNARLKALITVATDLTAELDFDSLFPLIVGKVTGAMNAERSSLYIIDWEKKEIWTKVAEHIAQIRLPLGKGISGKVAENGELINVPDAWDLEYYDREFDHKNNFRTKSVLCVPIQNRSSERIGVLQVINKKGKDVFDEDDENFLKGLSSQVGIALENSFLHEEIRLSFESSVRTLSATVDARHPLTAGHSQRVTEYSLWIAHEMKMDKKEIEILRFSALLHDIGKIGIRDEILLKNGPFSIKERTEMKMHTVKTKEILENFRFPSALKDVPFVAAHHHEKVNGEGYPDGLIGKQLTRGSKILAVADVFDALTSSRDYPNTCLEKVWARSQCR